MVYMSDNTKVSNIFLQFIFSLKFVPNLMELIV